MSTDSDDGGALEVGGNKVNTIRVNQVDDFDDVNGTSNRSLLENVNGTSNRSLLERDLALEAVAAEAVEAMGGEDASGVDVMSKGERRLGLRHRDSFVLQHAPFAPGHELTHTPTSLSTALSSLAAAANIDTLAVLVDDSTAGEDAPSSPDERADMGSLSSPPNKKLSPNTTMTDAQLTETVRAFEDLALPGALVAASPAKQKSRLRTLAKGVASALGLRKSKKRRAAEEASSSSLHHDASSSSSMTASLSPLQSPSAANSSSSSSSSHSRTESFFRDVREDQPYDYATIRDEGGDYTPSHRRHPGRPVSIVSKGSASTAGGVGGVRERNNISFSDQHGHELRFVRFSDRLHYSEGSEHVDWASGPSCAII